MREIKLWGVQFDEKLNFTSHTNELGTKGQSKSRGPSAATQPFPQGFSLKIWVFKGKALGTRLHLTYCHLVWHFCNASDRRKLEQIQERALRGMYKTRSASYQELLDRAKLPTLYNTRDVRQDIATLMFKYKHRAQSRTREYFWLI